MNFLIDVTEKKRNIVEKFKNNIFRFTEEELFLLTQDADMRRMSYTQLSFGRENWTEGSLSYFKETVVGEDIEYIPEDTFYYACLEQIDSEDLRDLDGLMTYSIRIEEIEAYFREKLKDLSYQPTGTVTNFILQILLDCNRYDLLGNSNQYYQDLNLSPEKEEDILSNYPFAYQTLPFKANSNQIEKKREDLESLNVYELFELFGNRKDTVFPILRAKIFSANINLNQPFSDILPFDEFYERLDFSDKEKFRNIMLHNNLNWYLSVASKEELEANVGVIAASLKKEEMKTTFPENANLLLEKEEILDSLVDGGSFLPLFQSPIISEYIPKLITKLKDNGLKKKLDLTPSKALMQYFQKYPEVFRVLLRNKYFYSFHAVDNGDVRGTVLEDIVAEEAIQNKGTFTLPLMADKEFFRKLLAVGNISCILENYHQFSGFFDKEAPVLLSEEESSQLVASIKNDIALQNSVLETLKSFVFDNPALLQFYLHSNSFILERTINYLNHHENLAHLYTDELYHEIKGYYALKYHLNLDKLDQLESTFGPTIIRFFDNDNLQRITCLEDKKFAKLIALFPKTEYSLSLLETAYDSLKQYAFSKENSDIISIFAHIKHSVQDGTEEYKTDLENLLSVMDEKFYKRFGKKYPNKVEFCKANPREFLEQLIKQIESQNPEEKGESLVTLHTITDYFIATKREQYREKYNMIEELKLPYEIDRKDFEKKVTDYLMQHDVIISYEFNISISSAVIAELVKGGMQPTLAQDVVNYYLKKDVSFSNDISVIQKNVRFAIPIMKRISLKHIEGVREEILISKFDQAELLKRNYYAPKSDIDPYQILTALRIDSLENNLLEDSPESEVIYQSLLHTMEKYKLHKLPSCFRTLLKSDSVLLSDDLTDVAGFISYYHQVYESEKKKLESQGKVADNIILSFTNVLINASVLSSASSVYNQFLGTEDTRLVKANPGPNYATEKTDREVRLKEAVEWTLKNFKKTEVTIPTFSEVVPFEDKQLRVVVGNFTHPSNITHGERTGACMRIGGIGESLFTFCLEDKNGFHIRFVDEKTGEYISRVSGFRNGNTVFLNELRHSCNTELYNDEEIIEACKKISSTMIEMSKDSTCPIENVFVARAYATENLPEINLGISNNKKGLKAFYSDIQTSGVLLATTEEPFARIELDKGNVPSYATAREKIYVGNDSFKLQEMMNRVHSVHEALAGASYEYVEPLSFAEDIVYGFANQDWYICMDSNGKLYEEIIPIDKRAQEELETARKLILEYVPVKAGEDTYQY